MKGVARVNPKKQKTGLRSLAELSQVTKKRIKKGIVKE
jgi:hypothetical protein